MLQNLLQLLLRFSGFWLFILLEGICFSLIISFNQKQGSVFLSSASQVSGGLSKTYSHSREYFKLNRKVEELQKENAKLKSLLFNQNIPIQNNIDTLYNEANEPAYVLRPAEVVSKTNMGNNNTFTLDKGLKDGIKPHMGVISKDGIVGVVTKVSNKFSMVMSVLNRESRISSAIKNRDCHGMLVWENMDPTVMTLESVPKHKTVAVNDTVISSGFSLIFPKGIPIGYVREVKKLSDRNSYEIKVNMQHDFFSLDYVYVIENILKEDFDKLEEQDE